MATKIGTVAIALLVGLAPVALGSPVVVPRHVRCSNTLAGRPAHDHSSKNHRPGMCGMKRVGEVEVSKAAGLGQVEVHGRLAAVVQRDEGAVALVDVKNPRRPKLLGRYDDDIPDSLDGDLAFSKDGKWLFYARQTRQFSKDGIHVLDVSDPRSPRLAFYQPQGGSLRIGYIRVGGVDYIASMDAVAGLVINRLEPTTGALVPVYTDPLPPLKVGGPASAGVVIDPKDPKLGIPLLYATNGTSGLDVYDLSQPEMPTKLGSWSDVGLADVEVSTRGGKRTIFAASEYWFEDRTPAEVYVLNATKLDAIEQKKVWTFSQDPATEWRVNGIESTGTTLNVALSHAGLARLGADGRVLGVYRDPKPVNANATLKGSPYVMDVDSAGGLLYTTDAGTGYLTILKAR